MNFEEWFEKNGSARDYSQTRIAWAYCKVEVLKILEKYNFHNYIEYKDLKKEIEKL